MKATFWIARDTSGELFAYSSEPQRLDFPSEDGQPIGYFTSGGKMTRLDKDLYPEITYENSPVKFENNMETTGDRCQMNEEKQRKEKPTCG